MSPCKGKTSWPELVGINAEVARKIIERENPNVKAISLPDDSTVVTPIIKCYRVRLFVDKQDVVTKTPIIG
ncbi:hypothetical protein L6164_025789 [Bauhinia variegata]|uniref:Uncharacterized protein n=1 Tax=Bauhinia variegata TaxID=167791 RepID=A0ACB9M1C5_BAUVA|nr:hypothetical protein L6164_025789 [Bauhinia variegata]